MAELTTLQKKIVNYAALDKFRELITKNYSDAIYDAFLEKVGELVDEDGNFYSVAQVVGTPITVEKSSGEIVVISLKDLIAAEVSRAKIVESGLDTRLTTAETDIDDIQNTLEVLLGPEGATGAIDTKIEDAITLKAVKVDGVELVPNENKAVDITGIKANKEAIDLLNADSKTVGSVDYKIENTRANLQSNIDALESSVTTSLEEETTARTNADAALQNAIDILNGESSVEGSVAKKIADGIAQIVADAPEDLNTLKEIADYIASDKTNAANMNNVISANASAIATLNGDESTEGSVKKQVNDAKTEIETNLTGVSNRVTALEEWEASLGSVEANAQVNIIETVKVDDVALEVVDKTVNIDLSDKADVSSVYTKEEIDTQITAINDQLVFATDEDIIAMFATSTSSETPSEGTSGSQEENSGGGESSSEETIGENIEPGIKETIN